jgi:hypothetical protein
VSHSKRAGNSFEVNFRNISNVRHVSSKAELYAVARDTSILRQPKS